MIQQNSFHITRILLPLLFCLSQRSQVNAQDDITCSSNQEDLVSCRALPFYVDYQTVTCLRQRTIETLSNKRDTCNSATGYCWYEKCQKSLIDYGFFPEVRLLFIIFFLLQVRFQYFRNQHSLGLFFR